MITTERITNWLLEPHQLQEVAPKALLQFAKEYPYFSLAQYLKFISSKQDKEALFSIRQAYPVNPVLLHQLIEKADKLPEMETQPILIEPATALPPQQEEKLSFAPANDDYFLRQGIPVSYDLPEKKERKPEPLKAEDKEKALMVVMSFAEWLTYISSQSKKAREEEEDQRALKTMWQKQKLAAAIEEESEEIPEQVFEMAVNSISRQDELISESLADVYVKQGKKEKAIDMYKKLSLQNPEKNTYFAAKIENLQKDL